MVKKVAAALIALLLASSASSADPVLSPTEVEVPFAVGPIKPDPIRNVVYVVDSTNNRLLAIDLTSGTQTYVASVDDGLTQGDIAISVDDSKLYLAESDNNEVMVFSLPSLSPLPSISLSYSPSGIASASDGRLFVSSSSGPNIYNNFVRQIDPSSGATLGLLSLSGGLNVTFYPAPILRINADGTNLYAGTPDLNGVMILFAFSTSEFGSPTTSYEYRTGNMQDFLPDETYGRIYVETGETGAVDGIDVVQTATHNFSTIWPFSESGGGLGISYNAVTNVVYGSSGSSEIREFSRTDGTPIADFMMSADDYELRARGLAATANGNLLYVRAPLIQITTSVIGVLGSLTQPIVLYPTLTQTITFPAIGAQEAGDNLTLQATDSAGLPITYTVISGPATVSGNILTLNGAGTVVIAANQAGNSVDFSAAQITQTITVAQKTQTISAFNLIPTQTYGVGSFSITFPTATSGLPVSVAVQSGPATLSGKLLTITGAGTVILAADQAGSSIYAPAPEVTASFVVNKKSQTISSLNTIATQTYGTSAFTISIPTSSSGLPVMVTVQSGPATLSGTSLALTGAGTVLLAADQSGNANYSAAPEVTTNFVVNGLSQKISAFKTISTKSYTPTPFSISPPTSDAGLPVVITILSGPATISGNEVTLTGVGTVELAANQPGDGGYSAALQVTTTFKVNKASQTITSFQTVSKQTYGVVPFDITLPTSSSELPVTTTVKSGPATISGNVVTVTGAGTVKLVANQASDAEYDAATQVSVSFTVAKASETLSGWVPIPTQSYGEAPLTITPPTASSGLPLTITVKSGPAKVSGDVVTITGVGTVELKAAQAGNSNYDAATSVTTSFTVSKGAQTINAFAPIPTQAYGEAAFKITPPTATSGLTVTVSVLSGPAKISDSDKITLSGTGTVTLQAAQAGNSKYDAATPVTTSFTVTSP